MSQNRGPFWFRELCRTEIGDNVWLVVSERSPDKKIVVARALVALVEGQAKTVYMPDPLTFKDKEALANAANCLMDAVDKLDKRDQQKTSK